MGNIIVACSLFTHIVVSPAKTAEPFKMPFRLRMWVGSGGPCIRWIGCPGFPMVRGSFEGGKGHPVVKYRDTVQKRLNQWRCHLAYGPKESCVMLVQR